MKKIDSTNFRAWLEKGSHDLEDAKRLLKDGGYTDTICFLAQQAAEKYLKGYLVSKKINPRAIHHLQDLAQDCSKFDKRFLDYVDGCLILTRYYPGFFLPALQARKIRHEPACEAGERVAARSNSTRI